MKLSQAARYFNDTRCEDSYSGLYLFHGQLDVYTEGVRDGVTVQRRVLELAPETLLPGRLSIRFGGDHWLMGARNVDIFKGRVIREKYTLHRAEGLAKVHTLAGLLSDAEPFDAYAGRVWVKTRKEIEEDSEEFNLLNIYFSRAEPVKANHIIELSGRFHIVKEVYPSTAGHLAASSEMMDEPVLDTAQTDSTGLDPITEQPIPGASFRVVRLRWQSDFRYMSQMTPKFERGDMQVAAPLGTDVRPGSRLTLSDGSWHVVGTQTRDGVLYLHLRSGH